MKRRITRWCNIRIHAVCRNIFYTCTGQISGLFKDRDIRQPMQNNLCAACNCVHSQTTYYTYFVIVRILILVREKMWDKRAPVSVNFLQTKYCGQLLGLHVTKCVGVGYKCPRSFRMIDHLTVHTLYV